MQTVVILLLLHVYNYFFNPYLPHQLQGVPHKKKDDVADYSPALVLFEIGPCQVVVPKPKGHLSSSLALQMLSQLLQSSTFPCILICPTSKRIIQQMHLMGNVTNTLVLGRKG